MTRPNRTSRPPAWILCALGCLAFVAAHGQPNAATPSDQAAAEALAQGISLIDLGEYSDAIEVLSAALSDVQDPTLRGDLLNRLAWANGLLGASKEALALYAQARQLLPADDTQRAALLAYRVGLSHRDLGAYDQAENELENALALYRGNGDMRGETTALDGLAGIAYFQADFAVAADLYEQALRRMRDSEAPPRDISIALNNLAGVYYELGDLARAEMLYGEALAIRRKVLPPKHPMLLSALVNLGSVFEAQGDAAGAAERYEAAIEIAAGGPVEPIALDALGRARRMQGRSALALDLHEQALALRRQRLDRNDPYVAESLNNIAEAQLDLDLPELARQQWVESLLISERANEPPLIIDAYDGLTRALARQGLGQAAVVLGKLAVTEVQEVRDKLYPLPEDLEQGYTSRREPIYRSLSTLLIDLGRLPEASAVLDLVRNEELYQFTRGGWIERITNARIPLSEAENALAEPFLDARRALRAAHDEWDSERLQQAYAEALSKLVERLTREPAGDPPAEAAPATLPPGARLDATSVKLTYVLDARALRIVATLSDRAFQRQIPLSARELNQRVFEFRRQVRDPQQDPRAAGQALYDLLLAPVLGELDTQRITHLQLTLDGALRYVPFTALHDGERFLIERYTITRTSHGEGSDTVPTTPAPRAVAFGITEVDEALALPPLPYVEEELEKIVRRDATDPDGTMPGEIYLDERFSLAALTRVTDEHVPNLHIASHFVFSPGRVSDSYLLVGNGERITLPEFAELDFTGVGWLALSACETALGDAAQGRGLEIASLGALARARGANAVLASLWRVSDRATSTFMRRLYRERAAGESGAAALRTAQLDAIYGDRASGAPTVHFDDPRAPYAHPYFWAAFVVMTD
ncbi:MAG: CHAT domain-containing protein [Pseudomonadota bacterium]